MNGMALDMEVARRVFALIESSEGIWISWESFRSSLRISSSSEAFRRRNLSGRLCRSRSEGRLEPLFADIGEAAGAGRACVG